MSGEQKWRMVGIIATPKRRRRRRRCDVFVPSRRKVASTDVGVSVEKLQMRVKYLERWVNKNVRNNFVQNFDFIVAVDAVIVEQTFALKLEYQSFFVEQKFQGFSNIFKLIFDLVGSNFSCKMPQASADDDDEVGGTLKEYRIICSNGWQFEQWIPQKAEFRTPEKDRV